MADISCSKEVYIDLELTDEEFEVLNRAYHIMKDIASDLWREDNEECDVFDYAWHGYQNIDEFVKLANRRIIKE